MISSFDYYKQIESPEMYLCNPDQRFLCALNGENRKLTLRFNDLSELTFTVPKVEGTESSYNLIETKRLIFIDKIGWFQITTVTETIEGDRCSKSVTAKSHQTIFADRGFVTEERIYMFYNPNDPRDEKYDSNNKSAIPSVCGQLYQQLGIHIALSSSDIEPSSDRKEWTLIYIDPVLHYHARSYSHMYEPNEAYDNVCRSFEAKVDSNGYDFMVNQAEKAFEVVFEFDFLYHTIKVKTLDAITKPTSIYLSFQNVINTLDIKENSEDIVTVMTCEGNDLDITTVNPMGTNYIVDFSYYMKERNDDGVEYPWMSKELIDALKEWETEYNDWCDDNAQRAGHTKGYSTLVKELQQYYTDKTVYDADLQYANLKITDMMAARDQYIGKDDKELEGSGYVTAESVAVGDKSLLPRSRFYTTTFEDSITIVGHTDAPSASKVVDKTDAQGQPTQFHYEFAFSDSGTSGTPKSLIEDYIGSDNDNEENKSVPFYFMDNDNRSYCKITVASEAGVVKDGDGFIASDGTAEVRGVTFTVRTVTGGCRITAPDGSTITTSQSNSYFVYNGTRYRAVVSTDGITSIYCFYVSGFERYTTYTETVGDGGWVEIWQSHINKDIMPDRDILQAQIDAINKELQYITDICDVQKFIQRKGQKFYDELSTYWVEGSYSNDNYATYDTTTMAERIDLAQQLMDAARIDLQKASQPKYELTVDAINFIKILEFKQFTDELALGRSVTLEKSDDVLFRMALLSMEYELDTSEEFTLTFSNASKPDETAMTFADLIKESSSVSRTVASNWSNLTDYARNKEGITNLILAPLDRTLRAAQEDMVNQQFIVDDTGILGRKWSDDSRTTFEKEQIRIINNTLLFTNDNWETASLALGKIRYGDNGEEAYGLVADVLIGNLLFGSRMKIINQNGNITFDQNGIVVQDAQGVVHFEVTPDGDVSILNYATSSDLSGATETLRGEIQTSAEGLRSDFKKTLEDYSTTTEMESAIKQSADNITLSVKETLKSYTTKEDVDGKLEDYSTTTEMESAIKVVADSLTAYAKKTEGNTTSAFGYTLTDTQFSVWNGDQNNPVLRCDKSGLLIVGNGTFSGNIEASGGFIGGFTISSNNISSGEGGLTFNADGTIITKQMEITGQFGAKVIGCDTIQGRATGSAAFDFQGTYQELESVSARISYVVNDSGSQSSGFYSQGSVTVTITTDKTLKIPKVLDVWASYSSGSETKPEGSINKIHHLTIAAGSSSGSIVIPCVLDEASTERPPLVYHYARLRSVRVPPGTTSTSFTQPSGVTQKAVYCDGGLIPSQSGSYLGDESHGWRVFQSTGSSSSDKKLKQDICDLSDKFAYDLIMGLTPRTYKFRGFKTPRMRSGFIAQEVETLLLSLGLTTGDIALVNKTKPNEPDGADNYYSIEYDGIIAPLVKVVQILDCKIKRLEALNYGN